MTNESEADGCSTVVCIDDSSCRDEKRPPYLSRRSVCGRTGYEWRYTSLANALAADARDNYPTCCPECRRLATERGIP